MITAREKRKNNIAEYLLYMYQVEDLIRANNCDIEKIKETIVPSYNIDDDQKAELIHWWENLTEMMKLEHLEERGHLQILVNTVNELNSLHGFLMKQDDQSQYQMYFRQIVPFLKELEQKTQPKASNDIELMLSAIYNSFFLKLKGSEISGATQTAIQAFARFLALLSEKYKEEQDGKFMPE